MNESLCPEQPAVQGYGHEAVCWPLRHITLAGLHWPAAGHASATVPRLLLHGWLDNSLSFSRLAPELTSLGDLWALDMAGHGLSDHRPPGQSYLLADYVVDLAELIDTQFDTPVDLIGHSLGGIVSMLYAAAFPEKVRRLVMIDSLGPMTKAPEDCVDQLRKGIRKRLQGSGHSPGYPTLEAAAQVRSRVRNALSDDMARLLLSRNLRRTDSGYEWRTDPRLRHSSLMTFTEPQAIAIARSVQAPALLLRAREGLLADPGRWASRRDAMASLTEVSIPGSHHCHLDGDVGLVASEIRSFLAHD